MEHARMGDIYYNYSETHGKVRFFQVVKICRNYDEVIELQVIEKGKYAKPGDPINNEKTYHLKMAGFIRKAFTCLYDKSEKVNLYFI